MEKKRNIPGYPPDWAGAGRQENIFAVDWNGFPIPIIFVGASFKSARYLRDKLNSFPTEKNEKMSEPRTMLMEGLQGWNILFI